MSDIEPWRLKGELTLSCNCTVFCPCVLSLGKHPPTEGYCQTWGGVRIDQGHYGATDLAGLNLGLVIEIPGLMSRGRWTAGVYLDDRADAAQEAALTRIMTGQARGTTHILSILVGEFLGVFRDEVRYEADGPLRRFKVGKVIDGEVAAIPGAEAGKPTVIENSQYWISPTVVVAQAVKSRFRAFGRNWDFKGRSAEICPLDWRGP